MYRLRVVYCKGGMAIFISEKNFQKIIERVMRRISLPLKFTEGFSPHPRMSFGHPLPVGIKGTNEMFDIFLEKKIDIESFLGRSRSFLPEGIRFVSAGWVDSQVPSICSSETFARYIIELAENIHFISFEKMGRIIEYTDKKIIIEIKLNNFSHKEMISLLREGKINSITREISN